MSKLQQAIDLIKAGDKQRGGQLLAEILRTDPEQETAWLWMSGVVDEPDERRYCLEQVLALNPANQLARDGLARLQPAPPAEPEVTAPTTDSGEPEPAKELVEFVVSRLVSHARPNDVAYELCEQHGLSWTQAEALVHEVAVRQQQRIGRRQTPILLVVGLITILIGIALFAFSFLEVSPFLQDFKALALAIPWLWWELVMMAIGTAMVIGGLLGIWRALSPSRKGALALDEVGRARHGSLDDTIGMGVYLSDDDDWSSRRHGRRRIRLL
jgi:hypothetical protein